MQVLWVYHSSPNPACTPDSEAEQLVKQRWARRCSLLSTEEGVGLGLGGVGHYYYTAV